MWGEALRTSPNVTKIGDGKATFEDQEWANEFFNRFHFAPRSNLQVTRIQFLTCLLHIKYPRNCERSTQETFITHTGDHPELRHCSSGFIKITTCPPKQYTRLERQHICYVQNQSRRLLLRRRDILQHKHRLAQDLLRLRGGLRIMSSRVREEASQTERGRKKKKNRVFKKKIAPSSAACWTPLMRWHTEGCWPN